MSKPFLIVQLSDPHIGADWGPGGSVANLSAAVDAVRALETSFDAVLVTGDLADHATDDEYAQFDELLAPLEAPLYVLPGNHDDRDALHRHFGVPGANGEPVQYAVDLGPLRLVVMDSTRPGEDPGELDATRLAWLEATLHEAPSTPTLLAMHHPPIVTGIPPVDEAGIPSEQRRALAEMVERHPQVLQILGGHNHRTIVGTLGSRPVLAAPSTYVQMRLAFTSTEVEFTDRSTGFAVHSLRDDELISVVHTA